MASARSSSCSTSPQRFVFLLVVKIIDRRQGWNASAPDEGLLVWHVDDARNNSWQDMTATRHYRLSVEQSDGRFDLEKNSSSRDGDLYHEGYRTLFDATTTPNSSWWSGTASGLGLSYIGPLSATMRVRVGSGGSGGTGGTGGTGGASTGGTGGGTSGEPCVPKATICGGQSGNFNTTGAYCFRTPDSIAGWGCSNFDGRLC